MAQEKQTPETRVIVAMAILTCFMDGCGCVEQVTQPRKIVPDLDRTHSGHVARYETYTPSLNHQTIKRVGCFGERWQKMAPSSFDDHEKSAECGWMTMRDVPMT